MASRAGFTTAGKTVTEPRRRQIDGYFDLHHTRYFDGENMPLMIYDLKLKIFSCVGMYASLQK